MLEMWPDALKWNKTQTNDLREDLRAAVLRLDQHSRTAYKFYYGPIEELVTLAKKNVAWYHMDVFPLRETDQKQFTAKIRVPRSAKEKAALCASKGDSRLRKSYEWDASISKLFHAFIDLLKKLQPKVVVVLNSHVSGMLEYRLPLYKQPNGHRYECVDLPGVVFLLGSQLSGGATSTYGKERLLADLRDLLRGKNGLDGGGEELARE